MFPFSTFSNRMHPDMGYFCAPSSSDDENSDWMHPDMGYFAGPPSSDDEDSDWMHPDMGYFAARPNDPREKKGVVSMLLDQTKRCVESKKLYMSDLCSNVILSNLFTSDQKKFDKLVKTACENGLVELIEKLLKYGYRPHDEDSKMSLAFFAYQHDELASIRGELCQSFDEVTIEALKSAKTLEEVNQRVCEAFTSKWMPLIQVKGGISAEMGVVHLGISKALTEDDMQKAFALDTNDAEVRARRDFYQCYFDKGIRKRAYMEKGIDDIEMQREEALREQRARNGQIYTNLSDGQIQRLFLEFGMKPGNEETWLHLLLLVYRDSSFECMRQDVRNYFLHDETKCLVGRGDVPVPSSEDSVPEARESSFWTKNWEIANSSHSETTPLILLFFDVLMPKSDVGVLELFGGKGKLASQMIKSFSDRITKYDLLEKEESNCQKAASECTDPRLKVTTCDVKEPFPEIVEKDAYDFVFAVDGPAHYVLSDKEDAIGILDRMVDALKVGGVLILASQTPHFVNKEDLESRGLKVLNCSSPYSKSTEFYVAIKPAL